MFTRFIGELYRPVNQGVNLHAQNLSGVPTVRAKTTQTRLNLTLNFRPANVVKANQSPAFLKA
jgi:hypothetical protein